MTRAERIAGCLFGAAIGDALGSAFELIHAAAIERHLGEAFVWDFHPALRGSLLHPRAAGMPTDDTAMALSVAGTIAGGQPLTARAFARSFLSDLEIGRGRYAAMFWNGGPGGATTRALARLRAGADPATCGRADDGGNGAAMRAHPAGFVRGRDEVLRAAANQAGVTHGHPAAIAAAQAVALVVHDALSAKAPSAAVPEGIDDPLFASTWQEMHRDLTGGDRLPPHLRNVAMNAWATASAAHAISLVHLDAPVRAIAAAAASGGDTDTIACIVGAIVGARAGIARIPARWITRLAARSLVGEALHALRMPAPATLECVT